MVHILTGHYPAGGSTKTMFQFLENYNSGSLYVCLVYYEMGTELTRSVVLKVVILLGTISVRKVISSGMAPSIRLRIKWSW